MAAERKFGSDLGHLMNILPTDTMLKHKTEEGAGAAISSEILKSLRVKTKDGEVEFRPLMCETLSEEDCHTARNELHETEEIVRTGLQKLREFLIKHDIASRTDDYFLLQFLRCQKFNIKKSKLRLKNYCTMMQKMSELFQSVDLNTFNMILDLKVVGFLPYRDKYGRVIIYNRGSAFDPRVADAVEVGKCALALWHFSATFPPSTINGFCYIGEGSFTSSQYLYAAVNEYRKYLSHLVSYPYRIRKVDLFFKGNLLRYLYKGFSPVIPKKIRERVHIYGTNLHDLTEAFHPSILPYEFGGTMGPLNNDSYRDRFLEYVAQFKAEIMYFKPKRKNSQY